jgi:hypothetical protein
MTDDIKPPKTPEELRKIREESDEKRKKKDKNYMSILYDHVR